MATATLIPPFDIKSVHTTFGREGYRQDLVFQNGFWYLMSGAPAPSTLEEAERVGCYVPPEFYPYVFSESPKPSKIMAEEEVMDHLLDDFDFDDLFEKADGRARGRGSHVVAQVGDEGDSVESLLRAFSTIRQDRLRPEEIEVEPDYDVPAPIAAFQKVNATPKRLVVSRGLGITRKAQAVPQSSAKTIGRIG